MAAQFTEGCKPVILAHYFIVKVQVSHSRSDFYGYAFTRNSHHHVHTVVTQVYRSWLILQILDLHFTVRPYHEQDSHFTRYTF